MKLCSLLCLLVLSPSLHGDTAATFQLGSDHDQIFDSENVGLYYGTLK
ncbi:MAG TPA: hypothetical protein VNY05_35235 [Candidatus Acidoferrales bacterium]|nr:hypothetical protein [Candidatus Acidoferrales bacterium]